MKRAGLGAAALGAAALLTGGVQAAHREGVSSSPPQIQRPDAGLFAADNAFGFRLFEELTRGDQNQNLFISPVSVSLALRMVSDGAKGETRKAMQSVLLTKGSDATDQGDPGLLAHLAKSDTSVTLNIASGIWAGKGGAMPVRPEFVRQAQQTYQAEVGDLTGAPASINDWVRRKTHGRISEILNKGDMDRVVAVLASAVYFKGTWTEAFDAKQTKPALFTSADGHGRNVAMMHYFGSCSYLKGDGFQAVSLPYGKGDIRALFFLPDAKGSLAGLESRLKPDAWQQWRSRLQTAEGILAVPRFRFSYEANLKPPLSALGMGIAFEHDRADFSGMAGAPGDIWIGKAVHKSFVEVNERGTEAAAATGVVMKTRGARLPTLNLALNRPFLFAIEDKETGAILFLGQVVEIK